MLTGSRCGPNKYTGPPISNFVDATRAKNGRFRIRDNSAVHWELKSQSLHGPHEQIMTLKEAVKFLRERGRR